MSLCFTVFLSVLALANSIAQTKINSEDSLSNSLIINSLKDYSLSISMNSKFSVALFNRGFLYLERK